MGRWKSSQISPELFYSSNTHRNVASGWIFSLEEDEVIV
jgi:hypothetical protein